MFVSNVRKTLYTLHSRALGSHIFTGALNFLSNSRTFVTAVTSHQSIRLPAVHPCNEIESVCLGVHAFLVSHGFVCLEDAHGSGDASCVSGDMFHNQTVSSAFEHHPFIRLESRSPGVLSLKYRFLGHDSVSAYSRVSMSTKNIDVSTKVESNLLPPHLQPVYVIKFSQLFRTVMVEMFTVASFF